MYKALKLKAPFFEFGPKAYLYGQAALDLALAADEISRKYEVQIIYTAQYVDIPRLAEATTELLVFAQHMDPVEVGVGVGSVLAEAIKEAGAVGTMLNHSEKRVALRHLAQAIKRANEVGLGTLVCADSPVEAAAIAQLGPNAILAEPPELIGSDKAIDTMSDFIPDSKRMIAEINPEVLVMHSAGIRTGKDIERIVRQGAMATGSTSGIIKAADPAAMFEEMVRALRETWDELHGD